MSGRSWLDVEADRPRAHRRLRVELVLREVGAATRLVDLGIDPRVLGPGVEGATGERERRAVTTRESIRHRLWEIEAEGELAPLHERRVFDVARGRCADVLRADERGLR